MLDTVIAPWPNFTSDEIDAVGRVLASNRVNYWTGSEAREFERGFADWTGTSHAIALANGTVALDLALQGLSIGPGDEVIVTPRTFIASVSSVLNCGATPVFADVDRDSGNITPASVERVMSDRSRAIIPVHLGGWPADMPGLMRLAKNRQLAVIEDCAQAHGASIDGRRVGAWSDIAAWSFCQDKIITTGGEGGMVTTDREDLWRAMWSYKDHGKSYEAVYERQHPPGYRWLHETIGTNWRITEIQAAIGRIQLARMTGWTAERTANAHVIADTLARYPSAVRLPLPAPGIVHAFYRLYAYVRPEGLKPDWSRDRIAAEFQARRIPVGQGSCSEVYREKALSQLGLAPAEPCTIAQELGETSLAFLVHPGLSDADLRLISDAIDEIFSLAAA